MLPILATIGGALAWFAATAGQLIFWGVGITIGFWVGKKITNTWDQWGVTKLAQKLKNRYDNEQIVATAAASTHQ